jgi:hypothetical protein
MKMTAAVLVEVAVGGRRSGFSGRRDVSAITLDTRQ